VGVLKFIVAVVILAGIAQNTILTDTQLTMVAILLAGFIAHSEE